MGYEHCDLLCLCANPQNPCFFGMRHPPITINVECS